MQNRPLQRKHFFDYCVFLPNVLSPAQLYAERGGITGCLLSIS
ncbi:hypothetical protein BDK62_11183 [Halomonas alkaliantarctica]|nr:hypothetical protein BDK62_11183 [Halomonas alkaliantarctica]